MYIYILYINKLLKNLVFRVGGRPDRQLLRDIL